MGVGLLGLLGSSRAGGAPRMAGAAGTPELCHSPPSLHPTPAGRHVMQASGAAWKVCGDGPSAACTHDCASRCQLACRCAAAACPLTPLLMHARPCACRRAIWTSLGRKWCSPCASLQWPSGRRAAWHLEPAAPGVVVGCSSNLLQRCCPLAPNNLHLLPAAAVTRMAPSRLARCTATQPRSGCRRRPPCWSFCPTSLPRATCWRGPSLRPTTSSTMWSAR